MNVTELINRLRKNYPDARLELHYENGFQLLIAVMLSAQARDETINQITPELFKVFPEPRDLANASLEQIESLIKKSGFYRRKAKLIKECAKELVRKFNGTIPKNIEELAQLPGVGRKTAAMVLGNAFNVNQGIAVDTHVKRVVNRLGWIKAIRPEKIEERMMQQIPQKDWTFVSNALILHGRRVCKAKNPECDVCILQDLCKKEMGPSQK